MRKAMACGNVWFFPEQAGVKGWSGTAPIMFVGLNPSTGAFPSKAVYLLYNSLRKNGLPNAHITDILKIRLDRRLVEEAFANRELVQLHKGWLREEVRILKPNLIVALGKQALVKLKGWLPERCHSKIVMIHHYSWAHRYGKEEVFTRDVAKIGGMYLKITLTERGHR